MTTLAPFLDRMLRQYAYRNHAGKLVFYPFDEFKVEETLAAIDGDATFWWRSPGTQRVQRVQLSTAMQLLESSLMDKADATGLEACLEVQPATTTSWGIRLRVEPHWGPDGVTYEFDPPLSKATGDNMKM